MNKIPKKFESIISWKDILSDEFENIFLNEKTKQNDDKIKKLFDMYCYYEKEEMIKYINSNYKIIYTTNDLIYIIKKNKNHSLKVLLDIIQIENDDKYDLFYESCMMYNKDASKLLFKKFEKDIDVAKNKFELINELIGQYEDKKLYIKNNNVQNYSSNYQLCEIIIWLFKICKKKNELLDNNTLNGIYVLLFECNKINEIENIADVSYFVIKFDIYNLLLTIDQNISGIKLLNFYAKNNVKFNEQFIKDDIFMKCVCNEKILNFMSKYLDLDIHWCDDKLFKRLSGLKIQSGTRYLIKKIIEENYDITLLFDNSDINKSAITLLLMCVDFIDDITELVYAKYKNNIKLCDIVNFLYDASQRCNTQNIYYKKVINLIIKKIDNNKCNGPTNLIINDCENKNIEMFKRMLNIAMLMNDIDMVNILFEKHEKECLLCFDYDMDLLKGKYINDTFLYILKKMKDNDDKKFNESMPKLFVKCCVSTCNTKILINMFDLTNDIIDIRQNNDEIFKSVCNLTQDDILNGRDTILWLMTMCDKYIAHFYAGDELLSWGIKHDQTIPTEKYLEEKGVKPIYNDECLICQNKNEKNVMLPCRHKCCNECFVELIDRQMDENKCPYCRQKFILNNCTMI